MKVSMKVRNFGGHRTVNSRRRRGRREVPFGDALGILAAGANREFRSFMKAWGGILSVFHSVGHIC